MEFLAHSLSEAIVMIFRLDRDLVVALATTLRVSICSTAIASAFALPIARKLAAKLLGKADAFFHQVGALELCLAPRDIE